MFTMYVYVLDTLADWEPGYVISELNSGRFFKKDGQRVSVKTVSCSKDPITTMGGMTIVPNCLVDEMVVNETSMALSSRKQANFFLQGLWYVQYAALPPRLPISGCWIIARIPVMDRDFLKWFLPVIRGKAFIQTSRL